MLNKKIIFGATAIVILFFGFFSFAQGRDTTKPVIKLIGTNIEKVVLGSTTYTDEGAVVTDNVDKDRNIDGVISGKTNVVGTYYLNYNATDANGNVADEVMRTINVLSPEADEDGDGFTNLEEVNAKTDFDDSNSFPGDKIAPIITFNNYVKTPTNKDIIVNATTNEGTLNTNSHTFVANGSFDFIATDAAGNVTTKTVTINNIDKTAPVITIDEYTTEFTNKDITVNATANEGTLNVDSHTFAANGSFDFIATDAAGNVTTKTVTINNIDKTAPKFDLASGFHTTGNIKVNVLEDNLQSINVYNQDTKTNISVSNGFVLTSEATYNITATDMAGNKKDIWVAIDRSNPTIIGVTNNGYYNKDIQIKVYDKFLTKVTLNDVVQTQIKTVGSNNEGKELTLNLSNEGIYTIVGTDKVGNTTTVKFTIDKTTPKFVGLNYGSHYTNDILLNVDESNLKSILVFNEDKNSKTYVENQTLLTEDATYNLIALDLAGNESNIWIAKDETNPLIVGAVNNGIYNKDVTVTVSDKYLTSVLLNGVAQSSLILDGPLNKYKHKTITITEEGIYTVIGTDKVGNTTKVKFTIDKTAPASPLLVAPLDGVSIKGTSITNSWTSIPDAVSYIYESYYNASATSLRYRQIVDAPSHAKSATNVDDSVFWWRVKSVDAAGNESSWSDLRKIIVDNTKPIIKLNGNSIVNVEVYSIYTDEGAVVTDNNSVGLVASSSSTVNTSVIGTYTVKYNVTDEAGNIADEVTRTVNVVDTTKPVINLNGGDMTLVVGQSFTDPGIASVSDNYATLTVANVIKTGFVNANVDGTYILTYKLTDGFNTETVERKVIVKPLINQLLVYNPNEATKYNGFNISFNRNFVVTNPNQIKIQYEYSIDGGSYVLANLVKYPGLVSSDLTYQQEEYDFLKDFMFAGKTTTFYGMLNADGGKILYSKNFLGIESFKAGTIAKNVVVSMQEHEVQDRLRTAYNAVQSGKTVLIRTILTFKLENGASVVYKLDPVKYN